MGILFQAKDFPWDTLSLLRKSCLHHFQLKASSTESSFSFSASLLLCSSTDTGIDDDSDRQTPVIA
jgi:hypothetical protein